MGLYAGNQSTTEEGITTPRQVYPTVYNTLKNIETWEDYEKATKYQKSFDAYGLKRRLVDQGVPFVALYVKFIEQLGRHGDQLLYKAQPRWCKILQMVILPRILEQIGTGDGFARVSDVLKTVRENNQTPVDMTGRHDVNAVYACFRKLEEVVLVASKILESEHGVISGTVDTVYVSSLRFEQGNLSKYDVSVIETIKFKSVGFEETTMDWTPYPNLIARDPYDQHVKLIDTGVKTFDKEPNKNTSTVLEPRHLPQNISMAPFSLFMRLVYNTKGQPTENVDRDMRLLQFVVWGILGGNRTAKNELIRPSGTILNWVLRDQNYLWTTIKLVQQFYANKGDDDMTPSLRSYLSILCVSEPHDIIKKRLEKLDNYVIDINEYKAPKIDPNASLFEDIVDPELQDLGLYSFEIPYIDSKHTSNILPIYKLLLLQYHHQTADRELNTEIDLEKAPLFWDPITVLSFKIRWYRNNILKPYLKLRFDNLQEDRESSRWKAWMEYFQPVHEACVETKNYWDELNTKGN